eukprot:CAMPEP_0115657068 /NCGR_PEP_ID=MMETSP0272-20121206/44490_1 /TAXON_ID=71861 /ORGANISM="Scrippsiella trochoidea, Strain CCMP3099" /LENGTH=138 /DNA_ID=CAMNT_0003095085 /DNA_START=251 /DNA_END=667 /DNA_ORIENTATION=+
MGRGATRATADVAAVPQSWAEGFAAAAAAMAAHEIGAGGTLGTSCSCSAAAWLRGDACKLLPFDPTAVKSESLSSASPQSAQCCCCCGGGGVTTTAACGAQPAKSSSESPSNMSAQHRRFTGAAAIEAMTAICSKGEV